MDDGLSGSRLRITAALGIVQIFAWGSSFYLMSIIAAPVAADTGWPLGTVTAGLSVALLCGGLASGRIGALIAADGGRRVMAAGMGALALGLVLMASARGPGVWLLAWAVMGLGMGAGLYDAAFSTLGRIYGSGARRAITALTLWGGFASTVCWPISAYLLETLGWRGTCLAYAALNLGLTAPLCWFGLPKLATLAVTDTGPQTGRNAHLRDRRYWLLAATGTILVSVTTIWLVHLMTLLTALGYALASAVALGTLIGPSQVGARVIEMLGRERHHPAWTLLVSVVLIAFGFWALSLGIPAAVALIAFGAGNGIWSIARGSLPLALFGPRDYPRVMGHLAAPILAASALAPLAGSLLIARLGAEATLSVLAMATLPLIAIALYILRIARAD